QFRSAELGALLEQMDRPLELTAPVLAHLSDEANTVTMQFEFTSAHDHCVELQIQRGVVDSHRKRATYRLPVDWRPARLRRNSWWGFAGRIHVRLPWTDQKRVR